MQGQKLFLALRHGRGGGGFVFDDPVLAPHIDSCGGTMENAMGLDTEVLQELIRQVYA